VGRGAEQEDTGEEEEDEEREANKVAERILAEEQLENRLRYFSASALVHQTSGFP
jgi:hypothetical protein